MKIVLDKTVYEAAIERIEYLFDEFKTIYVSFSGGKDSTTVLNLALEVAERRGRLPLKVFFLDQEAEWQAVIDYVRTVMYDPRVEPVWLQIPFKLTNSTSETDSYLHCWEPGKEDDWIHPKDPIAIHENKTGEARFHLMFEAYMRWAHPDEKAAMLAGVRTEESPARYQGLTSSPKYRGITWAKTLNKKKHPHWTFYPIYDWSYKDVWKYIHDSGVPYCTPAGTQIWMADYTFKPIEYVRPGDQVIGFLDPEEGRSTLCATEVLATESHKADLVKITLESGRTLRCTADHRWVRNPSEQNGNWRFGPAQVGDHLAHVIEPHDLQPSFEGAWLGGLYDGEGCGRSLSQSMSVNPEVCAEIRRVTRRLGIPLKEYEGTNCRKFQIVGGRSSVVRFLAACRPVKGYKLEAELLSSRYRTKDKVISIEPDGHEAVFSLQTTEGSYVADGYASSNCKIYDLMYQHGVSVRDMRVSSLHHQTAVRSLYYLQEIEQDTWDRMVNRIGGIHVTRNMEMGEMFQAVKKLPFMFRTWQEYRDHLLDKMITDPYWKQRFATIFARDDEVFKYLAKPERMTKVHIATILANDTDLTKINDFNTDARVREYVKWRRGKPVKREYADLIAPEFHDTIEWVKGR